MFGSPDCLGSVCNSSCCCCLASLITPEEEITLKNCRQIYNNARTSTCHSTWNALWLPSAGPWGLPRCRQLWIPGTAHGVPRWICPSTYPEPAHHGWGNLDAYPSFYSQLPSWTGVPHTVVTGFEENNKYELKNALGQRVYFAAEDTDCLTRNCCGPARPFTLRIIDNLGREVITLHRPLRCNSCCCPCCLQELEVQAPPGTTVGYVVQNWHVCLPKFTIQDEKRRDILKISGPCVVCQCCEDVHFEVMSLDKTSPVGKISKQWTGFVREMFTDTDNFGISFPMDLDVKMKAVMIGACFLIDFMFFEHSGD
ncbi:phospholipid scramblase 2 isoform X1 [Serinus canaria]|uniref:phospholipid scramblase 2 isoform X1 n=1 Tax=Serinus canaria TaxID=9135 RepID=UPI0021CC6EE3|nr:phospholipid scramblase 2 isoform X1 [Serinus canaria]